MPRRSLDNARVLLTGASSGIGRALALELAQNKARLLLLARREERLQELVATITQQGGEASYLAGDVTDPAVRAAALDACQQRLGGLDVLVNNAGVGAIGPFADASPERLRQVMEVNFFAPAELLRAALPLLRQGRRPLIVNVASVLAHRAVPKKSEYCASKFALHGLSDALRAELAGARIDVLLVSPSTTQSEFFDNVLETNAQLPWLSLGGATSEYVARCAVRAMRRGRHEVILTVGGKALVWFDRLLPWLTDVLVARWG